MRPHQWVKNLLVFAALIFSRNLTSGSAVLRSVLAFVIFCLLSGCVYILNDIVDLEKDKQHPEKSLRPLASGKLSKQSALLAVLALGIIALGCSFWLNVQFGVIAVIYLAINLAYSGWLKQFVIIDVMVLASFYVLRAMAGAEAIRVDISPWLIICTLLLALFLAFGKRRHELVSLADNAVNHRAILREYSATLIDQMISVVTASTVMVYILYTVSDDAVRQFGTKELIYTTPFVIYGIFRYLFLLHRRERGGNPSKLLLADKPLLVSIMLWLATVIVIIYK